MALRATFLAVVAVTLAGHLVALGFEIAVAARFGTGLEADALAFALTLLVTLTGEVTGWLATLFIPLYIDARATGPARAAALVRRVLGALVVLTPAGTLARAGGGAGAGGAARAAARDRRWRRADARASGGAPRPARTSLLRGDRERRRRARARRASPRGQ